MFIEILPYFILSFVFLLVAHGIAKYNRFYAQFLAGGVKSRYDCLDGLRGFLALGVFFAHGIVMLQYYKTGTWTIPPIPFYTILAEMAVALFFMISGFLFWGKVLASESGMPAIRLYRSRFARLTPLYVFSVLLVFLIVAVRTDFQLNVTVLELMKQGVSWLSFGFLGIPPPDINGLKDTYTMQSIIWTLTFEWEFYLLLPLLSRLPFRTPMVIILMFLAGYLASLVIPVGIILACFGLGALAAALMKRGVLDGRLGNSARTSLLAILILGVVFLGFDDAHGIPQYLVAFLFFMLILNGIDLFGLLRSRAAILLGTLSYSIYLLHNIVLYVVFLAYHQFQDAGQVSYLTFWGLVGLSGLLAILFSLISYRYIEHPFLAKKTSHYSRPPG